MRSNCKCHADASGLGGAASVYFQAHVNRCQSHAGQPFGSCCLLCLTLFTFEASLEEQEDLQDLTEV